MCYMDKPDRVGVRELRQNLSVYLRRVLEGERLEVTERGRPVAMLIPLSPAANPVERLVAMGRAHPPKGALMDLLPPKGRPSRRLSEALEEERAERL